MRTKFKAWAEPYINEHKEISLTDEEISLLSDIYLEIGCGKGEFILEMAKKFPDRTFIAIERNVTCAGFSAKKIVENELNNVKLLWGDAEKLLEKFPSNIANIIYLNFSDPWPKVRHHKRRLTSDRFCLLYHKVLKNNGFIRQKTDNEELFNFSIETFTNNKFNIKKIDRNYITDLSNDSVTEYEEDFRKDNLPIFLLEAYND